MQKSYLDKAMIFLGVAILIGSYLLYSAINRVADYGEALTSSAAQINNQLANMSNFLGGLSRFTAFGEANEGSLQTAQQQTIMLSKEEAQRYLNLTEKELNALIDHTDIPYVKLNQSFLFPRTALDEWAKKAGKAQLKVSSP
ncbi:UNVERIFIED_CONTAM: excisionase family DNA binding protein [Brevibacillus sp. OAP136]